MKRSGSYLKANLMNVQWHGRVPSDFHHGLVMFLHRYSHLMDAGIEIRHLCDWALFLNSIEEKEFLMLFQEPLQNMGLWVFAQTISLTSVLAFGLERQNWMGTQEELAGALLPLGWFLLYIRRVYRVLTGKGQKCILLKYIRTVIREKSCINNCIFLKDRFPQSCVKVQISAHLSMEVRSVFYLRLVMNCGNLSGCEDRVPPVICSVLMKNWRNYGMVL